MKMNEQLDCRLSPDVVSISANPSSTNVPAQGNLLRSHNERLQTLPENMLVIQASETVGFMRKISGQSMVWMMDLEMLELAEYTRYLEMMKILLRKDGFEEIRKLT